MADSQRKTANLFDEVYPNLDYTIRYLPIYVGDGTFTASTTTPIVGTSASLWILQGNVSSGAALGNSLYDGQNRTVMAVDGYITIAYRITSAAGQSTVNPSDYVVMLNAGETPLPYEPYGWVHSLRKLGTSTDTITTLPVDLYADGQSATVGLVGNMSQTGTGTPTTPIQPQETGERTENLVEYYIAGCNIDALGRLINNGEFNMFVAKIVQGQTYSLDTPIIGGFFTSEPSVGSQSYNNTRDTSGVRKFIAPIDGYVAFRKVSTEKTAMLNLGETALPYEPYGQYKIPILSANTTTPVYLGEVQSTRKIKKVVLTGQEAIASVSQTNNTQGLYCAAYQFSALGMDDIVDYGKLMNTIAYPIFVSSHFVMKDSSEYSSFKTIKDGEMGANSTLGGANTFLILCKSGLSTVEDYQTYFQQQYAAGTPVTFWYILATPTTGIVNEPLRKIGNYADTVSGITIPTITGADSIDVQTTLKPSEVSLSYTGWHDATVKEWDGSEWD